MKEIAFNECSHFNWSEFFFSMVPLFMSYLSSWKVGLTYIGFKKSRAYSQFGGKHLCSNQEDYYVGMSQASEIFFLKLDLQMLKAI